MCGGVGGADKSDVFSGSPAEGCLPGWETAGDCATRGSDNKTRGKKGKNKCFLRNQGVVADV